MKIWLPSIRAKSGSDVYVERLAALIAAAGHEPAVSWFPRGFEFAPWLLKSARLPVGTDIVHANSWNAFAFARTECPLVTTVHHCVRGIGYPAWKSRAQMLYHERWIAPLEQKSFEASSSIVAVSQSTASDLSQSFGVDATVINNWIDTQLFRPSDDRDKCAARVLFVGNLSRRKGGDLLPAFRKKLNKNIELHIVSGRRGNVSSLQGIGPNTKIWTGLDRAELIRLYQACDITVCLSRHEGFGYAVSEAMACGRPVVAFDVAGIKDVIEADVTGRLLPCEDIMGVATVCHELIDDPKLAQKMGLAARARAVEFFSTARAQAEYAMLYERVMAGR